MEKTIRFADSKYLIIDLTKVLTLSTEVFPGDPKPKREVFSDIKDGWQHYVHVLGDHVFQPHADAPNHQNPEMQDKGIEFFDLDYFFNEAILIDLSDKGIEINDDKTQVLHNRFDHFSHTGLSIGYAGAFKRKWPGVEIEL